LKKEEIFSVIRSGFPAGVAWTIMVAGKSFCWCVDGAPHALTAPQPYDHSGLFVYCTALCGNRFRPGAKQLFRL